MRKTLTLCALLGAFLTMTATPIDLQTAHSVAAKFMETNDLQLSATYKTNKNTNAFYVFNTTDGFVIVAADDCETPIIAYSHEGLFDPNNVPMQMEDYLQNFVARIQYSIENQIVADKTTTRQWGMVKATGKLNNHKDTHTVAPLLTSKWHQDCLYNSLCPTFEQSPCGHAEVGCAAVAMGQIMRYHGYPATGWGSHSYTNGGLSLSANFGNTTYNWELMPDSLTDNSSEAEVEALATLLFHCGISVNMAYSANGSNANTNKVTDALVQYFDYARQISLKKKSNYNNDTWSALLKGNLDQQHPVLYLGNGTAGHAFVCDGYDDNGLFHFNWGWGGSGDGYFTIGNLNPLGYDFSSNNQAIVDIIPQYDPCQISVSVYPTSAGTIEGTGSYHIGEQCSLTAVPAENCKFYYWKKNGQIKSNNTMYSFTVNEDVDDIEAVFSFLDTQHITASYVPDAVDQNYSCISLSWSHEDIPWNLVKEFEIEDRRGVATDGEYIYTFYPTFEKYNEDGELVEQFDIPGAYPENMAFDGQYFYCCNNKNAYNLFYFYCYDLANKILVDSTYVAMQYTHCAYDTESDGFWLCKNFGAAQLNLYNRQGEIIQYGPGLGGGFSQLVGFGEIYAQDGTPHFLIVQHDHGISDFDVVNNCTIGLTSLDGNEFIFGAAIGKYKGKDAVFTIMETYNFHTKSVKIYEIPTIPAQIISYRLYRADQEGQSVMIAEEVNGSSFIDSTWKCLGAGEYRYGISSIFSNGVESEIVWSEPIVKTNHDIKENDGEQEQPIRKVFENGQIVIIKDGKHYSVSGQRLN